MIAIIYLQRKGTPELPSLRFFRIHFLRWRSRGKVAEIRKNNSNSLAERPPARIHVIGGRWRNWWHFGR
jgi:hypothetical protein